MKYKPHGGGFTEGNKLLLRFETNRPSADSATILGEWRLTAISETIYCGLYTTY